MPIVVSQIAIEEPDSAFPDLPKPPESLLKDPEMRAWWSSMEDWWKSTILAVRAQAPKN